MSRKSKVRQIQSRKTHSKWGANSAHPCWDVLVPRPKRQWMMRCLQWSKKWWRPSVRSRRLKRFQRMSIWHSSLQSWSLLLQGTWQIFPQEELGMIVDSSSMKKLKPKVTSFPRKEGEGLWVCCCQSHAAGKCRRGLSASHGKQANVTRMVQQDAACDWIFGNFYKGVDGRRNHDSLRFKTDRSYKDLVNLLTVSTCFDRVEKVVQEKCWDQWMERSTSWSSARSLWPWAMNVIEMTTAQAVLKRTKKRCRGADHGHILSCWDLLSVCFVWSTSFLLKKDWAWLSNNQLLIFYKNVLHEVDKTCKNNQKHTNISDFVKTIWHAEFWLLLRTKNFICMTWLPKLTGWTLDKLRRNY